MINIISIAGASGSGKTTLSKELQGWLNHHYGEKVCSLISEDNYYNDFCHLSLEERALLNFDDPLALDHDFLWQQLTQLKAKKTINIPQYCFKTHRRTEKVLEKKPLPFLIIEGIQTFYHPKVRQLSDYKIFVNTDVDVCLSRRILRDIKERERTLDSVINQYFRTVKPMYLKHVAPLHKFADICVDGAETLDQIMQNIMIHPLFQSMIAEQDIAQD